MEIEGGDRFPQQGFTVNILGENGSRRRAAVIR
jgi:hypothetical protein